MMHPQGLSASTTPHQIADAIHHMSEEEKNDILNMLSNRPQEERRHRFRKVQQISAQLGYNSQLENSVIENLSPTGAFLSTIPLFPKGTDITLRFRVLNYEFPLVLSAEIVWVSPDGMGIRFKPTANLAHRLSVQKLFDAMQHGYPES